VPSFVFFKKKARVTWLVGGVASFVFFFKKPVGVEISVSRYTARRDVEFVFFEKRPVGVEISVSRYTARRDVEFCFFLKKGPSVSKLVFRGTLPVGMSSFVFSFFERNSCPIYVDLCAMSTQTIQQTNYANHSIFQSTFVNEAHPYQKNDLLSLMLAPKRIVFIVNPKSGTQLQTRIRESVDQHLNHRKFEYSIWHTEYPGHATELSRRAVAEGYEIVVAVGGDGSINEVAAGLLHTDVVLGIVPAGSGNGLAMHLGYGRQIASAVRKLNSAEVKTVDCGLFNGRPFVNVAGVGFDGLVSNLMKNASKRGFLPYFLSSIKAGLEYTPKVCSLEANGTMLTESCFAIAIANGPMYGYNFQIAPGAKMDDGLLSVVVLKKAPRWQYFATVPSMLNGKILEAPFVEHFTTSSLTIRSEGENFLHLDGEGEKMTGELKFEILPMALKILVPK
jgi:diacylglycerol kinase (ATP)